MSSDLHYLSEPPYAQTDEEEDDEPYDEVADCKVQLHRSEFRNSSANFQDFVPDMP